MKMKRIIAIIKGKAAEMSVVVNRKANRVIRNVEQGIDWAEDQAEVTKDVADSIMSSLGEVSDGTQTEQCSVRLNQYVEKMKEHKEWLDTIEILKDLKTKLTEEVEVTEEESK